MGRRAYVYVYGMIRYAVGRLDVPESDIKGFSQIRTRDAYRLHLHNWRTLTITGFDLFNFLCEKD